jgi:hypothetical protein
MSLTDFSGQPDLASPDQPHLRLAAERTAAAVLFPTGPPRQAADPGVAVDVARLHPEDADYNGGGPSGAQTERRGDAGPIRNSLGGKDLTSRLFTPSTEPQRDRDT